MNEEVHSLLGAYALDALDDVERVRFTRHLFGCGTCQSEVEDLLATAVELAALTCSGPPPELRARVLEQIHQVRPLPPVRSVTTDGPEWRSFRASRHTRLGGGRRRIAAVAAGLGLVGGAAAGWAVLREDPPATLAERILAAPDATRAVQRIEGGGTATVVRSGSADRAVLVGTGLPNPPKGSVLQVWLRDPTGGLSSAGVLEAGGDQVVVLTGDASRATGAGITVEPAPGSAQPTTRPIMFLTFG